MISAPIPAHFLPSAAQPLRYAPLAQVVAETSPSPRRGRPMCRPGHGSVAGPIHGRTHRSAPTERSGGSRDHPSQRRTVERLRQRMRGTGWESRQRSSPKCTATPDNPSVSLRLTAPFTQGSLGDGDADCRVGPLDLLTMTTAFCHSEERSDVGIRFFTMDGGSGSRGRRPLRKQRRQCAATPGGARLLLSP